MPEVTQLVNVELKFKHRQSVLFIIVLGFLQKEHWNDCYKTRLLILNLLYNNGVNLRMLFYLEFHCSCTLYNLGGGIFYKLKSDINSRYIYILQYIKIIFKSLKRRVFQKVHVKVEAR